MLFNFDIPVKMISGEGCVLNNSAKFSELGKRAVIVTGAHSAKLSGALDDVTAALDKEGIAYTVFDGIKANPSLSDCKAAGDLAKSFEADFIVGIGGGSPLDAARAAAVYAAGEYERPEDIYKDFKKTIPLICVGTTSGTGSEVDGSSVLSADGTGFKRSISGKQLYARYAFCDYRYTMSMSLRGTVSTGLDALCHALESWFSKAKTEAVLCMSRRAVELIFPWLERMSQGWFEPDNAEMRREMYYGSLWAGLSIGLVGTGFPHPMGYPLTELGGLPHGIACAVWERSFIEHSLKHCEESDKKLLLAAVGSVERLYNMLGTLTENNVTISESAVRAIGDRLSTASNTGRTLGDFSPADGEKIAKELFLKEGQSKPVEGSWLFGEK